MQIREFAKEAKKGNILLFGLLIYFPQVKMLVRLYVLQTNSIFFGGNLILLKAKKYYENGLENYSYSEAGGNSDSKEKIKIKMSTLGEKDKNLLQRFDMEQPTQNCQMWKQKNRIPGYLSFK